MQLLWPSISLKTFTNLIGDMLGCEFVGHQGFSLTWIVQGRGYTLNCWVDILIKGCTSMNSMIFEILTDTYGPQRELQDPNWLVCRRQRWACGETSRHADSSHGTADSQGHHPTPDSR